jgi:chromosome segregation ATPase
MAEAASAELRGNLVVASQDRDNANRCSLAMEEQVGQMQIELDQLKGQVQKAEENQKAKELVVSSLGSYAQQMTTQASESSRIREALEKEKTALQAQLESSQVELKRVLKDIESLRTENKTLRADNAGLTDGLGQRQNEAAAAKDESRRLAAELEASSQALQQSRAELQDERKRGPGLDNEIAALEERIRELEESISTCWLHGFCAWMSRLGKSSKSASYVAKGKSPAEEGIALKQTTVEVEVGERFV